MKLVHKIKVKNALGIHTRPAAMIVKLLHPRKSTVHFTYKNETINARSIISIFILPPQKNTLT